MERLAGFEHFTLTALAAKGGYGTLHHVYVHSKAMLVDDAWATVGSCNLHAYSLGGHTELNMSVWDAASTKSPHCELFDEHLEEDTRDLDDREALARFHTITLENRARMEAGIQDLQGITHALDPFRYAL